MPHASSCSSGSGVWQRLSVAALLISARAYPAHCGSLCRYPRAIIACCDVAGVTERQSVAGGKRQPAGPQQQAQRTRLSASYLYTRPALAEVFAHGYNNWGNCTLVYNSTSDNYGAVSLVRGEGAGWTGGIGLQALQPCTACTRRSAESLPPQTRPSTARRGRSRT